MFWKPAREWENQTAFIVGGGPSLRQFDFNRLTGQKVIGCNEAFRLGPQIVSIVIYGDESFFARRRFDLEKFGGPVVTSAVRAERYVKVPWLRVMRRKSHVLGEGDTLGWNYSTGAAAVSLAVLMGSSKIYLLGFDLGATPDKKTTHWHSHHPKQTEEEAFQRFIRGFQTLHQQVAKLPVEILNVTNGDSRLPSFPRISFSELDRVLP
jgi:hypothetical protein